MPRRKALKVIVDVHLHAITCPGVFLPEQHDVFLYVEMLGQRKRTQSTPPVFPFLFHEKLRFDKVFSHCTDPVQIASALSGETVRIELVQLTYPAGQLLATYEDNARDFLFPTPRACPSYPGVDREVLLERASSFPGIAPKFEFSSRTVIKEVTSVGGGSNSSRRKKEKHKTESDVVDSYRTLSYPSYKSKLIEPTPTEPSTSHPSKNRPSSSKKKTKQNASTSARSGRTRTRAASLNRGTTQWGYEQPTVASLARSPSPYTKRRMAQLSIKDPFDSAVKTKPFKTELEERPSFVVRKASGDCLSFNKTPPSLPRVSPSFDRRARSSSPSQRSPGRRKQTPGPPPRYVTRANDYDSDDSEESSDEDSLLLSRRFQRDAAFSASNRYDNFKHAYYRPITPECCLSRKPNKFNNVDAKSYRKKKVTVQEKVQTKRSVDNPDTAEIINSSIPHQHRSDVDSMPTSARSAPESTPRRERSFSRNDLEREHVEYRTNDLDPDSILLRRPLRERFGTGSSPSPYEKIRDRVRDLLQSPRANQIISDTSVEARDRYWRRRSPSPRSSPRY